MMLPVILIIRACLIAEPAACETFTIKVDGFALTCVLAMPAIAEWSVEHPDWRFAKLQRCGR